MKLCTNNKIIIFVIFILLLVALLYLYFLINEKNTDIENYLEKVYINTKSLKIRYPNFINPDYKIVQNQNLIYIENILNDELFTRLQNIFINQNYETNNNIFRKGNGVNFINLHKKKKYNDLLSIYYSEDLLSFVNSLFNKYLQRISLNDKNACSLLIYTNKGDYIDWHYDISDLYGKRYTILLTLINKNETTGELSENEFIYKINGVETKIKLKENSLVIFDGSNILHKSTPINKNEKRILLSMVYCDVCQNNSNLLLKIYDKIKDKIAYNK
jgi:hypothetical protein